MSAPKLTEAQITCLQHFARSDTRGTPDGFRFGPATLASLRKSDLLERFRGYPWPGAKECALWRITDAGRAALKGEL